MNLYLYKVGETTPVMEIEDVVSYTADSVTTADGAIYAPLAEDCELSATEDCAGTLRAEWRNPPKTLEQLRTDKVDELSAACNAAIVAGMDVETSQGTEHFSLEETDQINLTTALSAVQSGAEGYPYHADGQMCRIFTAAEIQAIAAASVQHKLYHTTLCNHLLVWARRAETAEELAGITYSADNLPDDLAENMAAVLAAATKSDV